MSAATFHSAEILLERLQSDKESRPIVFLVGAPLSIAGSEGIPNVATTLDRIRDELFELPEARRQLDEHATQLLPGAQYQEAMGLLAAARGQDTVNRLIRTCVLEAYRGPRPPDVRDEEGLAGLEKDRERWVVPPGVSALGKLVGHGGRRLSNIVLTTNFDPLIEIAIARAGSTAIPIWLDSDGRLDQIESEYPVVVHLHGFWRRGDTLHVQSQLSKPRPSLVQSLRRALGGSRLVTIAYGGWHDVVAEALVGALSGPGEHPEILWTFYGTNEPVLRRDFEPLLRRLAPQLGARVQLYRGVDGHTFLPRLNETLSRESPKAPSRRPPVDDNWSAVVRTSSLWPTNSPDSLKDAAARLVGAARRRWEESIGDDDRWRHESLPGRVVRALNLLARDGTTVKLSPAEVAVAIVTPFVREAVLSDGVQLAREARPADLGEQAAPSPMRRAIQTEHRSRPQLIRKIEYHGSRHESTVAADVAWWLAHRAVLRQAAIWIPPDHRGGLMSRELAAVLDGPKGDALADECLESGRILRLAQCIFADEGQLVARGDMISKLRATSVGSPEALMTLNEARVARLLNLSGWLAIDPRGLDEVVVEHLGSHPPLSLAELEEALNKQLTWKVHDQTRRFNLEGRCPHGAIEIALQAHVAAADAALARFQQDDPQEFARMPQRLTMDGVEAAYLGGAVRYDRPHIRFELAQTEVRELLMGERLYSAPSIALREMYQNALDACRYRRARLEYLRRIGRLPEGDQSWQGRIEMTLETADNGAVTITCADTGVGMGEEELRGAFARAGRRFRDLPGYAREEADWLTCDPPVRLYPNSQFGIGVLSYFMLADEVELDTTRYRPEGGFGEALRVKIAGVGSLFQLVREGPGHRAGTTVRLRISPGHARARPVSVVDTLQEWLVVADFETIVREHGREARWQPNVPVVPPPCIQIPESDPPCWWVADQGHVLADGLRVSSIFQANGSRFAARPRGVIVNLTGRFRPRLSVDRERILSWEPDEVADVLTRASGLVSRQPWISADWLIQFARSWPAVGDAIFDEIARDDRHIAVGGSRWAAAVKMRVAVTGVGLRDAEMLDTLLDPDMRALRNLETNDRGRLGTLVQHISEIPTETGQQRIDFLRQHVHGAPVSITKPGDAAARAMSSYSEVPGFVDALAGAVRLRETVGTLVERLNRAAPKSAWRGVDTGRLRSTRWTAAMVTAFTHIPFDDDRSGRRLETPIAAGRLLRMALTLGWSLYQTAECVAELEPLGLEMPSRTWRNISETWLQPSDTVALSMDLDGHAPWCGAEIALGHVFAASHKLGEAPSETVRRFQWYEAWGVRVPMEIARIDQFIPSETELRGLSVNGDGRRPWHGAAIRGHQVWRTAASMGIAPSELAKILERFRPMGVDVENIGLRLDVVPRTELHRDLVDRLVRALGAFPEGNIPAGSDTMTPTLLSNLLEHEERLRELEPLGFSLQQVFKIARGAAWTHLGQFVDWDEGPRLSLEGFPQWNAMSPDVRDELAAAGLRLHFDGDPAAAPGDPSEEDLRALSRDMDLGPPFLVGTVSSLHIALSALTLRETFEESKARVMRWAPALGLTIEPDHLQE